jgi:hypothetical protein
MRRSAPLHRRARFLQIGVAGYTPEGLGDQGAANVLEFPVFFVAGLQKTGTLAWTP